MSFCSIYTQKKIKPGNILPAIIHIEVECIENEM